MKQLEKRIDALEARLSPHSVILYLADGTTRAVSGSGNFLYSLLIEACRGSEVSPRRAEQLALIRQSVDSKEPNGGRMCDLIRCFLVGPVETGHTC